MVQVVRKEAQSFMKGFLYSRGSIGNRIGRTVRQDNDHRCGLREPVFFAAGGRRS